MTGVTFRLLLTAIRDLPRVLGSSVGRVRQGGGEPLQEGEGLILLRVRPHVKRKNNAEDDRGRRRRRKDQILRGNRLATKGCG